MLFGHFTMQTKVWSLLEMEENKLISDMTKWGGRVPEGERNKCWRQSEACVAHEQWGFNMEYCTGMAWRAAVSFRASEGWSMLLICCLVCATAGMHHKDSHSQTWARGEHNSLNPCTLPSAGPGLVLVECHRVILDMNGGGASLCQKWHWAPHGWITLVLLCRPCSAALTHFWFLNELLPCVIYSDVLLWSYSGHPTAFLPPKRPRNVLVAKEKGIRSTFLCKDTCCKCDF